LVRTPLLYPIRTKDYASNAFIANEWMLLQAGFEDAFMITIFGYSGPKTDAEAIGAMEKAWGPKRKRNLEQTAFITIQSDSEINENWKAFIHILLWFYITAVCLSSALIPNASIHKRLHRHPRSGIELCFHCGLLVETLREK